MIVFVIIRSLVVGNKVDRQVKKIMVFIIRRSLVVGNEVDRQVKEIMVFVIRRSRLRLKIHEEKE